MNKTYVYTILFLLLFVAKGSSQNLVPNNSFEDTVSTPLGGVIEDAAGWINCGSTPDYYNPGFNSDGFGFGVPNCFYTGYQNALDGFSFVGLGLTALPEQPAEFIGISLSQPLSVGTKYYVSAYISQADDYPCATNNFCFKFFNAMYFSATNPPAFDNTAHVRSTLVNSDSLNWQLVGGTFIADSAYQYLVIGNYFNLVLTDTFHCYSSDLSYYYIDNVCVSSDSTTCMIPTSITQMLGKSEIISIFPNPADRLLHIRNSIHATHCLFYNTFGEVSGEYNLIEGDNLIDVRFFSSGLYILVVDEKYFFKIIINHN